MTDDDTSSQNNSTQENVSSTIEDLKTMTAMAVVDRYFLQFFCYQFLREAKDPDAVLRVLSESFHEMLESSGHDDKAVQAIQRNGDSLISALRKAIEPSD